MPSFLAEMIAGGTMAVILAALFAVLGGGRRGFIPSFILAGLLVLFVEAFNATWLQLIGSLLTLTAATGAMVVMHGKRN